VGDAEVHGRGGLFSWFVVILLLVTSLVSMVDRFALSLLLEPIKADMGLTDTQLGLLSGLAFGLFYAAMSFPMGVLADRWSRKATIILGLAVWGLATAACGLAATAVQFAIARMLVGIGEAALAPCAYGMIHDRFPPKSLGRAMSVYQMGGMLGAGFAMFVAGLAYSFFLNHAGPPIPLIGDLKPWQQTFIVLALPCIPVMLLIAAIRDVRPVAAPKGVAKADEQSGRLLSELRAHSKFYFCTFVGISSIILVTYALLSWMPSVLMREYQWTAAHVGASYGWMVVISSVLGLLVGGTSVDLMMRRGMSHSHLVLSLLVGALSFILLLLLAFSTSATATLIFAGMLHFVMATPIGIIPAYVQLTSPAGLRGQFSSLYVMTVNIVGLAIGPSLVGFFSSLTSDPRGLRLSMTGVSACFVLIAIALLVMARQTDRVRRS
jgi:MFS family permease